MASSIELRVVEGSRKELGRQLIRAMIEFRSDDVRAIADRIARRGQLVSVDAGTGSSPCGIDTARRKSNEDSPHSR